MSWWPFGKKQDPLTKLEGLNASLATAMGQVKSSVTTALNFEQSQRRVARDLQRMLKEDRTSSEKVLELIRKMRATVAREPSGAAGAVANAVKKSWQGIIAGIKRERGLVDELTNTSRRFQEWHGAVAAEMGKAENAIQSFKNYLKASRERFVEAGLRWDAKINDEVKKIEKQFDAIKKEKEDIAANQEEVNRLLSGIEKVKEKETASVNAIKLAMGYLMRKQKSDSIKKLDEAEGIEKEILAVYRDMADVIKKIRGLVDLERFAARRSLKEAQKAS